MVALLLIAWGCAPLAVTDEVEAASSNISVSMVLLERNGTAPLEVKFDVLASSPFQPITLSWDFGDGETSTAWSPVHDYTASGTFLAVVTATDGHSYIDTDQAIIVVYPVTELTISSNATSGIAGDAVHFNSTINSDRNDLLYRWDFGDGGYSAETDPNHTFEKAGTYSVVCSVQDERGGWTESNAVVITINDAASEGVTTPGTGGSEADILATVAGSSLTLAAVAIIGIVLIMRKRTPEVPMRPGPGPCPPL